MSCNSCRPLCHFLFRGRVKVGAIVIVVVVAFITDLAVILVRRSICGIVGVIVGPVLSLKEQASVSVSDINAPGIAARNTVHNVDDVLWKGEEEWSFGDPVFGRP